jgi:predicted Fe-S protein YdhL (DUF1289 family)/5S rRNA maturation endonuclease (ribonuclease M5)
MGKYSTPAMFKGAPARADSRQVKKEYPPIDWARIDVISEIERHTSTRLHKQGKQWCGACPFEDCSVDEDGFIVFPDLSKRSKHYYCRGCRRTGDLINLLEELRGWSFLEAMQAIGLLEDAPDRARRQRPKSPARARQEENERRQAEQINMLRHLYPRMQAALLTYERPRVYLAARGILLEDAARYGLGYIPTMQETGKAVSNELARWQGRLIFPLTSPGDDGLTFAGRTLELWHPGMSPAQHKAAIDEHNAALPENDARRIVRVLKTSPCGHFGYREAARAQELTICEGEIDALSLLLAGIENVIAMGTGFSVDLIPFQVERVTLAMDADAPGAQAARNLAHNLAGAGLDTRQVLPANGKDWNDMYSAGLNDAIRALFTPPVEPVKEEAASLVTATPEQEEADRCADCGASIDRAGRDFFYSDAGVCYCSLCRDIETGAPRQIRDLAREEIAARFSAAIPSVQVEMIETSQAYQLPAQRREKLTTADYWEGVKRRLGSLKTPPTPPGVWWHFDASQPVPKQYRHVYAPGEYPPASEIDAARVHLANFPPGSQRTLTRWLESNEPGLRWRAVERCREIAICSN